MRMVAGRREHVDTVLVLPSSAFDRYHRRIAELALAQKLPTCSESSEYVRDGGLLSHGPDFPQTYFRATYVDRLLKGDKPGDLPIERPSNKSRVVLGVPGGIRRYLSKLATQGERQCGQIGINEGGRRTTTARFLRYSGADRRRHVAGGVRLGEQRRRAFPCDRCHS